MGASNPMAPCWVWSCRQPCQLELAFSRTGRAERIVNKPGRNRASIDKARGSGAFGAGDQCLA